MTLISITIVGLIAIPFGNPKFIDRAIVLELCFVSLSFLVWKGYTKPLYACVPIAVVVIILQTKSNFGKASENYKVSLHAIQVIVTSRVDEISTIN